VFTGNQSEAHPAIFALFELGVLEGDLYPLGTVPEGDPWLCLKKVEGKLAILLAVRHHLPSLFITGKM
jgi:hypothetical protein